MSGVEVQRGAKLPQATPEGTQRTADIPPLSNTSKAPSVVLVNPLSRHIHHPSTDTHPLRLYEIDRGPVKGKGPNDRGRKREDVATRFIQAADNREKAVFMPETMHYAHLLYWIWLSFIK
ncbi:hypothetical protein BDZ97DRAFT_2062476 [Flammula alnicola]|nr:hypothetical protein BDZ97DRAFT_2062476 [Flammula alnicola]